MSLELLKAFLKQDTIKYLCYCVLYDEDLSGCRAAHLSRQVCLEVPCDLEYFARISSLNSV